MMLQNIKFLNILNTKLFSKINTTKENVYVINYSEENKNCGYIVQALSSTELSDIILVDYIVEPILS